MRAQCESERQVEELFPASSTTAKVEEVEAGAGAGWLVGWLLGWLVGWLLGCLLGWLLSRLVGC